MYNYPKQQLINYLAGLLKSNLTAEAFIWLNETGDLAAAGNTHQFYLAFTAIPRKTGKHALAFSLEEKGQLNAIRNGFNLTNYTIDRLSRVWLLLNWPAENKESYLKTIGQLFKAAEMNELVALYGALPVLAYPDEWVSQCTEGIRSNIGSVLEAVICDNPYPSEHLNEAAWNQLVLKAIFTAKPIERIMGLEERSNKTLAYTLVDFAHERWAAGRTFDLQLWRPVGKFIDEHIYPDIKKVFESGNESEKHAAGLACAQSSYAPAKALLKTATKLEAAIENNQLNWDVLVASKTETTLK